MEQFKIRDDGFKEIRKAIIIKIWPTSLIVIVGFLAFAYFNVDDKQTFLPTFLFLVPFLVGVSTFGLFRGVKRQMKIFHSYRLTIEDSRITREQENTPTIIIPTKDVAEIIKNANGSFTIKGNSAFNAIGIPPQIERSEDLEKMLADINQISIKSKEPFLQKFSGLASILTIGLMATVYISKDKMIVSIAGAVLLVLMGYSFVQIQRSKNIDRKTKRGTWMLLLLIGSVIGIIYFKLTS